MPGVDLVGIYDIDEKVASRIEREFGVRRFSDLDALVGAIEAAVVAVPTVAHFEVGSHLLSAGVDVLIEKPLAASLREAEDLVERARGQILAVGHVEFFNPAVQRLLTVKGRPGFVEVHRLAEFTPRSLDIDVVLDLMIHDLQILHALDDSRVEEIRATGIRVLSDRVDIANARVALASGCVANLTASRVSSGKVRKLRVFLPASGYYSLDYQAQEIRGYRLKDQGAERKIVPDNLEVERDEPLRCELEAFVGRVRGEDRAIVDGEAGARALATALGVMDALDGRRSS